MAARTYLMLLAGLGAVVSAALWRFDSTVQPTFDDTSGAHTFDEE